MTATKNTSSSGHGDAGDTGPVPSTAAHAAVYQRLRSHLAYLKLPTTAEHLPAVLDAARTEQLSPTAALQRLLELEVAATEDRRLTGRLRFASLPAPWTLEELDYDASPTHQRCAALWFAFSTVPLRLPGRGGHRSTPTP